MVRAGAAAGLPVGIARNICSAVAETDPPPKALLCRGVARDRLCYRRSSDREHSSHVEPSRASHGLGPVRRRCFSVRAFYAAPAASHRDAAVAVYARNRARTPGSFAPQPSRGRPPSTHRDRGVLFSRPEMAGALRLADTTGVRHRASRAVPYGQLSDRGKRSDLPRPQKPAEGISWPPRDFCAAPVVAGIAVSAGCRCGCHQRIAVAERNLGVRWLNCKSPSFPGPPCIRQILSCVRESSVDIGSSFVLRRPAVVRMPAIVCATK